MKLSWRLCRGLIRSRPLRFALIGLCAAACFVGMMGLRWGADAISQARTSFETVCGTGDITVYTENAAPGELSAMLREIQGVDAVAEGVISDPVRCVGADGAVRSVRFAALEETVIHPIVRGDGQWALSYAYAADFSPENVSWLTLPGGREIRLEAVAYMPMFTGVYAEHFISSTDGDVVDVYTSFDNIVAITGECYVNYAVLTLESHAHPETVMEAISSQGDVTVHRVFAAREEPGYRASLALEELILKMCSGYPWLFFTVGMVFVCIFLAGVADRARQSMFALLTQGASGWVLFFGLVLYGLLAMFAGLVAAVPIARALAEFIRNISLENMALPRVDMPGFPSGFAQCAGACLLIAPAAGAVGVMTLSDRRVMPQRTGKHSPLRHICITAVSIAASVFMSVSAMIFLDSMNAVREEQFSDRYGYDVQIIYEDFVPVTRLEELENSGMTSRAEPMLYGNIRVGVGALWVDATCAGLSGDPLVILRDENGILQIPENGILLSEHTGDKLGVRTGDLVELEVRYENTCLRVLCQVAGVSRQSTAYLEAVSIRTVEQYLNSSGVMNSAAVTVRQGALEDFLRYVGDLPGISAVQTGQGGKARFDSRYAGTRVLILLIMGLGILLGLAVCLLMCYSQWKRDARKNTVLLMLGAHPGRVVWKSAGLRLPGLLMGLAAGSAAAAAAAPTLLGAMSTEWITYPPVYRWESFLLGALLCLGYELCCQGMYLLSSLRRVRRSAGRVL